MDPHYEELRSSNELGARRTARTIYHLRKWPAVLLEAPAGLSALRIPPEFGKRLFVSGGPELELIRLKFDAGCRVQKRSNGFRDAPIKGLPGILLRTRKPGEPHREHADESEDSDPNCVSHSCGELRIERAQAATSACNGNRRGNSSSPATWRPG